LDGFFSHTYSVDYRAINKNLGLTLPCLIEYLQETSIKHCGSIGYGIGYFKSKMEAFVLANWHVEVYRYPMFGENFKIVTFPTYLKSFLAERAFVAYDESGNMLAAASSKWVYIDLNSHLPTKPPAEMFEAFKPLGGPQLKKAYNFKLDEGYSLLAGQKILTKNSDVDSNRHVNNTRYIFWAMDLLSPDEYCNKKISCLKVVYKKECTEGQGLIAELYGKGNERIAVIKGEEEIYCNVYFILG
jgi:acyl-ACP thioesterase